MIVPKDRTLTKKQWKAMDSLMRKAMRKLEPEIERAFTDMVLYGRAVMRVKP